MQRQPRQLQFWPRVRNTLKGPQVWEALTPEGQTKVIGVLARLIRKAADPENAQQVQEDRHEP